MAAHRIGWICAFYLQDLFWAVTSHFLLKMLRPLTFSIIWGGILAIGLSFILATYYSSSLYAFFHDWTGWRSFTGTSPNTMTEAVRKILWSILFCSCWWMLWRLDIF